MSSYPPPPDAPVIVWRDGSADGLHVAAHTNGMPAGCVREGRPGAFEWTAWDAHGNRVGCGGGQLKVGDAIGEVERALTLDVLPGEDGGDYAARKAEVAAVADAARLPEWVLLAEISRRQRHGRPLVESVAAHGRYVYATMYHDGETPVRASLLFRTADEAAQCAQILKDARMPR